MQDLSFNSLLLYAFMDIYENKENFTFLQNKLIYKKIKSRKKIWHEIGIIPKEAITCSLHYITTDVWDWKFTNT